MAIYASICKIMFNVGSILRVKCLRISHGIAFLLFDETKSFMVERQQELTVVFFKWFFIFFLRSIKDGIALYISCGSARFVWMTPTQCETLIQLYFMGIFKTAHCPNLATLTRKPLEPGRNIFFAVVVFICVSVLQLDSASERGTCGISET